jgi:hypothetical protein
MPSFWDAMGPAYARLPAPLPFAPNVTADQIGHAAVAGVAAVTVVHGAASWVRGRRGHDAERRVAIASPAAEPATPEAEAPGVASALASAPEDGDPASTRVDAITARPDVDDAVPPADLDGSPSRGGPSIEQQPEPEPEPAPEPAIAQESSPATLPETPGGSEGPG